MREIKICHDLHMTVERFMSDELGDDEKFIIKKTGRASHTAGGFRPDF